MSDVGILEILLRRRRLIPLVALFAVLVGFGVAHKSGGERSGGFAQTRILLGAVNGPSTSLDGVSPQTLMIKAPLLADQLGTAMRTARLAKAVGIDPSMLAVRVPAYGAPRVGVPIAISATEVAAGAAVPNVLQVKSDDALPLLTISAQAPDQQTAARIVEAPNPLHTPRAAAAPPPRAKPSAQILVQQLGPVRARTVTAKGKPVVAVIAGFVAFGFGCCALVIATGLLRARRGARRAAPSTAPRMV
jgi:hypothetical protein